VKELLLFLFFFISVFSFQAHAQLPPTDSSWELKFSDEFDSLITNYIGDTSKWARQFPYGQPGGPEICNCSVDSITGDTICDTLSGKSYFTQWDDTTLANPSLLVDTSGSGTLRIIALKQNYFIHSTLYNFTSAMLYSKRRFKYGYFELKFKIPGLPLGPAVNKGFTMDWWMWNRVGLESNEIDMFEIRNLENKYTNNIHYKRDSLGHDLQTTPPYIFPSTLDSNWHVSAL
jgi:beta-glucanase (GH16 family)